MPEVNTEETFGDVTRKIDNLSGYISKLNSDVRTKNAALTKQVANIGTSSSQQIASMSSRISSLQTDLKKSDDSIRSLKVQKTVKLDSNAADVLKQVRQSMAILGTGMKDITAQTAQASKEAINQYGNAISQDISVNKQNLVAMSLAKTSPLFGYFASKFMETDVFKGAASRIKGTIGEALGSAALVFKGMMRSAGERVRDAFMRKPKVGFSKEAKQYLGKTSGEDVAEIAKSSMSKMTESVQEAATTAKKKIPKMQTGGMVEKGGLARVHPAEIIAPASKVFDAIDKRIDKRERIRIQDESVVHMGLRMMAENMSRLEEAVTDEYKTRKGLVRDFAEAFVDARDTKEKSFQDRLLKAVIELKVGLIGMTDRWRIALQTTLLRHPAFRNIFTIGQAFTKAVTFVPKALFRYRGGYIRYLPKGKNVFERIAGGVGLLFTFGMAKMDELLAETRTIRRHVSGELPPVEINAAQTEKLQKDMAGEEAYAKDMKLYTAFGKIQSFMRGERPEKGALLRYVALKWGMDPDAIKEAGITSIPGLLNFRKYIKKMEVGPTGMGKAWQARKRDKEQQRSAGEPGLAAGGILGKAKSVFAHAGEAILPAKHLFELIKNLTITMKEFIGERLEERRRRDRTGPIGFSSGGFRGGGTGEFSRTTQMFGIKFEKVLARLTKRQHKREEKFTQRQEKREEKFETKFEKRQGRFAKRYDKGWMRSLKVFAGFQTKAEKRQEAYFRKSDRNRARQETKFEKHSGKMETLRAKLQIRVNKRIESARRKMGIASLKEQQSIFRKGMKTQEKITKNFNDKILDAQEKSNKRILKIQGRIFGTHQKILKWFFDREERGRRRQLKFQSKLEKMQDKLRKKEEKQQKKIQAVEEKMRREELKYQKKLAAKAAQFQMKEQAKLAKIEGKAKFAIARKEMKQREQMAKMQWKLDAPRRKEERKLAKVNMKQRILEMKEKSKTMKAEAKIRKKELQARIKKAKEEVRAKKKEMWKARWDRLISAPEDFKKWRSDYKKSINTRMQLARESIKKLGGLNKHMVVLGEKMGKIGGFLKKQGKNVFKWLMMGLAFVQRMVGPLIGRGLSLLSSIAMGLGSGIVGGAGRAISGAGGMIRTGLGGMTARMGMMGAGGALAGGYMMAKDAFGGAKQAGKWFGSGDKATGAQKVGAGVAGALFGTDQGFKGAGKGALKGAAVGAAVGSVIPVVGTAVGGLVGSIAGAVGGFIGGERAVKAAQAAASGIKKFAKGIAAFLFFPFKIMKKMISMTVGFVKEKIGWDTVIKPYLAKKIQPLLKLFGFFGTIFTKIKDWAKEKLSKIPFIGKWFSEEKFDTAPDTMDAKVASAARGGITKGAGLTYLHPNELITPLSAEVKERVNEALLDKKSIAGRQANEAMMSSKMIAESNRKLSEANSAHMSANAKQLNSVVSNATTVISNSMSSSTNNSGGSSQPAYTDPNLGDVLKGDIV